MMEADLKKSLGEYVLNMPSLPCSAAMSLEVCNNYYTSPADLVRLVSLDPVFLFRLLDLANNIYEDREQLIYNPARAIVLLGLNTVKNQVVSAINNCSLVNSNKKKDSFDAASFWKHSLSTGIFSREIAVKRNLSKEDAEIFFTAGFLHDINKIPCKQKLPAGCSLSSLEWLKSPIGDAINYHDKPEAYSGNYKDAVYTVFLASYFTENLEVNSPSGSNKKKIPSVIYESLCINLDIFDEIKDNVLNEVREAEKFLKPAHHREY